MSENCTNTCPPKKSRRPVKKSEEGPIYCIDCNTQLILHENWTWASLKHGRRICKSCYNARLRKYYEAHKEERRLYSRIKHYKQRYNLTPEEVSVLKESGCAICGTNTKLVVDHCHKTSDVRGILCDNCNRGLGCFKDNPKLLDKAKEYLSG